MPFDILPHLKKGGRMTGFIYATAKYSNQFIFAEDKDDAQMRVLEANPGRPDNETEITFIREATPGEMRDFKRYQAALQPQAQLE